jgi:ribonuclease VapC
LEADEVRLVSAVTLVEVEMVFSRIRGEAGVNRLELFLSLFYVRVVPFDLEQATLARDAFLRYGKGRHKAGLNFGDCMTYALAKQTGEPLLFKGDDFSQTDLVAA